MKILFLGVAFTIALSSSIASADDNAIVGTWRVQSFVREVKGTGERQNEFGEKPNGYMIYQPDGRMFFMLVGDNRATPAATPPTDEEKVKLFGTLLAYSGAYVVEGNKVTHKIDLSWNQSWTGGDQVRFFKVDGTTLTITTAINKNPRDGREGRAVLVLAKTQ
jgi:hypothetical protein